MKDSSTDNQIFNKFFSNVFKVSGYNDSSKKRKAFRLKDISKKFANSIIHGVIEGGPYDSGKTSGNKKTKRESKKIGKNIIIQDDFYFLLQTKLNEKTGILILQTYGQENIDDIFKPFIKNLFKFSGQTYKAVIEPFIPNSIKDLAKETAIVSELNYSTKDLTVNHISDERIGDDLEAKFNIKISIVPIDESLPLHTLSKWRKALGNSVLKLPNREVSLDDFNSKTGYLKSDTLKNPTRFEIQKDSISVKPTIYLEKIEEVDIEENGTPNWTTLKDYCINELIPELENEVY
ncbi:hypothetical protein [Polaribacter sp. HaHaR_3_91]|uniref:hypothetical protein n=1 Tax=Polaribacter sp. HaHaR_3_91 TaxID=2745561 RepID=UPI001C4EBB83|nr:hypothetical protein [Polaribacter sp. HaHaR_3_91]QXP62193.1 hypothetical protein H0I27_09860 [Polaribacter sp. HaHaR_3_91]